MDEGGGGHFFRKFVFLRNFGNVLFFFFLLFVQLDIRFRNYGWKKEFLFRIMDCTSFGGGKFWRILEEIMIQDWSQFFVEINNFFF